MAEAERLCQLAFTSAPDHPEALLILARIALACNADQRAITLLQRALASMNPPSCIAFVLLATACRKLGKVDDAVACVQRALSIQQQSTAAYIQLGLLLGQTGRADDAERCYAHILEVQPQNPGAWLAVGENDLRRGRVVLAEQRLQRALDLGPSVAQRSAIRNYLGLCLMMLQRYKKAIPHFAEAALLAPDDAFPLINQAGALLWLGRMTEAYDCARQAVGLEPENPLAYSNMLFCMQFVPGVRANELLEAHRGFTRQFETPCIGGWQPHANTRDPDRRLRVGYVSGDFCAHAVAFFCEPVLAHHDKAAVEVYCYYNNTVDDTVTQRLRSHADHWRVVAGMADVALAEQIRRDGIDILIDLSGHSRLNRLLTFVLRPAPVQATWIGYPGTTGLGAAMDYRFTDEWLDPPDSAALSSEALCVLPRSAVFLPAAESPPVNNLPALQSPVFTFGCLNKLNKITPAVVALWCRILRELPHSRLVLVDSGDDEEKAQLSGQFGEQGVVADRIVWQTKQPLAGFLASHHAIDLALDPFPYGGGTTSYHALWMGVPVITLAGETTASRQGSAILHSAGLTQCVADSPDDYVGKALALAKNLSELQGLRASMRDRMAKTVDAPGFVRDFEAALRRIWRAWCEQE